MEKIKKQLIWLLAGLLLVVGCAAFAHGVDTQFGNNQVGRVYFKNANGDTMSGILYKPGAATAENPAPAIITAHGNNDTTDAQEAFNIELSRRGYVVLALDLEGHGHSDEVADDAGDGSYGGIAACKYLMSLDYVAADQIGATGHSKGSNCAIGAAAAYPGNVKAIALNGYLSPRIFNGSLDEQLIHTNVLANFSRYDEAGMDVMGVENALSVFNAEFVSSPMWEGETIAQRAITGEGVGNYEDGTYRAIHVTGNFTTHCQEVLDKDNIAATLEFFNASMAAPNWFSPRDQVWDWRYIAGLGTISGLFICLFAFASMLFRSKFFAPLCEASVDQSLPAFKKSRPGRLGMMLLFTVIPAVTFVYLYPYGESGTTQNAMFPLNPAANGYLLWTYANVVLYLLVFIVWHFVSGKKQGGNLHTYGFLLPGKTAKEKAGYAGKCALYALLVIAGAYTLVAVIGNIFSIDFFFYLFGIRAFELSRMQYFLQYFALFFIAFYLNGLVGSVILRDDKVSGGSEKRIMAKNAAMSVVTGVGGLIAAFAAFLIVFAVRGYPAFAHESPFVMGSFGYMCILWHTIPIFGLNGAIGSYMNTKSRRILLGALVCALFIVWMTFSGMSMALPSILSSQV